MSRGVCPGTEDLPDAVRSGVPSWRSMMVKIRFGQARERKQLQWRESFNVFSGVGFRCGSKGEKRTWSQWCHTRLARSSLPINFRI